MSTKKRIVAGVICILFLALAWYLESADTLLDSENRIARTKPGEGSVDVDLVLSADGLFENRSYPLTVQEVRISKDEAEKYFESARAEIDETFFSDGENADRVTTAVHMAERYAQGMVGAKWSLDSYHVMEVNGEVIEEAVPVSGELVTASAALSCGDYREDYRFGFMVYPREADEEERLLSAVDHLLRKQQDADGEDYLVLPDQVDGYRLEWEETRRYLVWKMLFFELLILILLRFVKLEREKEQERRRKEQMRLDYSEVVNKLVILLGAGMTLKQAWNRISARYSDKRQKNQTEKRCVYEEMLITKHEIADGVSETRAYQNFADRAGVGEYNRLVRILVQNLQTGNRGLCRLLEQEAQNAFEERRAFAKKLGEEAQTKLLLPMMLMLVIVIAMIMVPAMHSFEY